MAYVLIDDSTSWNVERVIQYSVSNPNDIAWDGRFVIVSSQSSIKFFPYELFDRSHMDDVSLEAGNIGTPRAEEFVNPITNNSIITRNTGGTWLAPYQNGVYVTNGLSFTSIKYVNHFNEDVSTINCPPETTMTSNLLCCNDKLWMTETKKGGDQLHIYDIPSQTWTQTTIPVREQQELRHLSHDKNNHVLITNYNDWSVCKYSVNGTYIEKVFLDDNGRNKEPTFIHTNSNRDTFILSFQGMISKFNTSTNSIDHFAYSGKDQHGYYYEFGGFESDTTHMWISSGGIGLIRMKLADKSLVGTEYGQPPVLPDLTFSSGDYTMEINTTKPATDVVMEPGYYLNTNWPANWKKIIIIPQMTKQVWDGTSFVTKTYGSHLCAIYPSGMFAIPNAPFWRVNSVEVGATGMVSSGPFNYTGD